MIFKKPYGFLIKHFKLIHLILTGLYIYLAIKVNGILQYFNNFIDGTASKLDAIHYINSNYIIVVSISIVICLIVYALMRYKKKPRALYLILVVFSILIAGMIQYSYHGLDTIYISVLDTKSLLLYRDLLRILIVFQYLSVAMVLVRGLGFDIKKFNFVQDLQELDLNVTDEEEVELTLGGTETLFRKLHRNFRELKYYYLENKVFILIILAIVIVVVSGGMFTTKEIINKEYQQGESFSTDEFQFQVLNSYVTNRGFDNQTIMENNTSFVVVRMSVGSRNGKKELNTSNLILKVNQNHYTSNTKYKARFVDLGSIYQGQKIDNNNTYLFVFNINNDDIDKEMKIVYAEEKTVYLNPIFLDEIKDEEEKTLSDVIDLSKTSLGSGSLKIYSLDVKDKFSYPYQYEIDGKSYTNQLSISSTQNVILKLEIEAIYPYNMEHYSFFERYVTLKYKIGDEEYTSRALTNKTPGNYKEGLYLGVDKKVLEATNIWLDIKIRNTKYIYILK